MASANGFELCMTLGIDRVALTVLGSDGPRYTTTSRVGDFNAKPEAFVKNVLDKAGFKGANPKRFRIAFTQHGYNLIPASLFDRTTMRKYLELATSETDLTPMADYIKALDAFGVYGAKELKRLESIFPSEAPFYIHQSSGLVQFLYRQNLISAERGMFILFNSDISMTIAAWELGKLLYVNDFQYASIEEALHFINFVPTSIAKRYLIDSLSLAGELDQNANLIKNIKKFSPHLKMHNFLPDSWTKAEQSFDTPLFHAYLLSQCE